MTNSLPTIADVLAYIEKDEQLNPQRRKDVCSGVRKLCYVLGLQPENTSADPARLRDHIAGLNSTAANMSESRLRNCKGYLEFALHRAAVLTFRRRSRNTMAPAYRALLNAVPLKWDSMKLTAFFRFASELGLAPEEVSDETFDAFLRTLENSIYKDPRTVDREARKLWNRHAGRVEGWPDTTITIPDYMNRYTLPPDRFPQSLWDDLDAYLESRRKKDGAESLEFLLKEMADNPQWTPGETKTIRASTAKQIAYRIRQFASALVIQETAESEELERLADLVTPERFAHGLLFFVRRSANPGNGQVHSIATDLYVIARRWVGVPEAELAKLASICKEVRPVQEGLPEKVRRTLAPFKDPGKVRAFLSLPDRVIAEVEKIKNPTSVDANRVATALWIKIAQRAPLRISNILGIDLEKNLLRSHHGKSAKVSLFFTAEEVKNNKTLEIPLPKSTVELLDLYLTKYRKLIVQGPSPWLFPAGNGGRKSSTTMNHAIKALTGDKLGFAINPHSFRHIAAKLYLSVNPGRYVDVQIILGHKKLETTIAYYCDLEAAEIFRHFDTVLLGLENPTYIHGA